jgi:histidine kinase/DNA gyrase B/HSP90-like ATPase
MRRHAEGLVILAGAPPGRAWSSPVKLVDVMRGAIAEVEDYARVSVVTRSQAALAGSAAADVIHLLAELIENATTLSPPYTQVRVSGDTVASGFAIEVEDGGLGISPARLAELNQRLANPPEFNPADSEQLGLFVVSQLARRHGILVTLKASPYGGTTAVVLIPHHLVVIEEASRVGLPGEPAAIGAGRPDPYTPRVTNGRGHHAAFDPPGTAGFLALRGGPEAGTPGLAGTPGVRISGVLRRSEGIMADGVARGAHHAGQRGAVAPARPDPRPRAEPPPASSPRAAQASGPPWELSRQTGPLPMVPGDAGPGPQTAGEGADGDGLPRRIRQASLAPELRADPPHRRTSAAAGPGLAARPTPTEIRQTMSALQRGWQEGRSQGPVPGGDPPLDLSGKGPSRVAGDQEPAAADEHGRESDGA